MLTGCVEGGLVTIFTNFNVMFVKAVADWEVNGEVKFILYEEL